MPDPTPRHETLRDVAGYVAAAVLAVVGVVGVTHLWGTDLRVPLGYGGDAFFTAMQVRGTFENGWYLTNPRLGAPGVCELHDFPLADSLHFALMKPLALLGGGPFLALNLYFLLTFPLAGLSAYGVLRRLGLTRCSGLAFGLLYTFLPYHFQRGVWHLFLSAYYLVPPMVLVVLWVWQGPGVLLVCADGGGRPRLRPLARRSVAAVLICLLVSSAGVYYAFFGCFFLVVAGLAAWVSRGRWYAFLAGGLLAGVVVAGGLANGLPHLLYARENGPNELTERSNYVAAEVYALKLAPLLLPASNHRVPALAELRRQYDGQQPPNESQTATLGVVGSVGFLFLLGRLLVRRAAWPGAEVEDGLSVLTGAGVLLATLGGFGCLFALLVSPAIRAYNRVSVYLAFFALLGVALLVERLFRRYQGSARGRLVFRATLAGLAALGVLDQTNAGFLYPYAAVRAMRDTDSDFVRRVEEALPAGAMVFQLPYFPFPEVYPPGRLVDYDHLRGYLYSKTLRWSYGAMKGRKVDAWQARVGGLPPEEMARALALAGFAGVYLDRHGYDDEGRAVEEAFRRLLDPEPIVSRDNRLLFFRLGRYRDDLRRRYPPGEWARKRAEVLAPLTFRWREGFSPEERLADCRWRWCCSPAGEVEVTNDLPRPRAVAVRLRLATAGEGGVVRVEGPALGEEVRVEPTPGPVLEYTLVVPPGTHRLRFTCDAGPVRAGGDPRTLYFRVLDFSAREVAGGEGPAG